MKRIFLLLLISTVAGCVTANKTANPPQILSSNISLDPINESRAILKLEREELVEAAGVEADKVMDKFCNAKKHKILVEGNRLSGEKKWTRIIVFECIEGDIVQPAPQP
jgi:hypothetical protein